MHQQEVIMDNETYLRVEQFRQLKEQIRGSEEYLIVGIDISKNQHHAFFGTPNGITIKRRLIFKNYFNGFLSLLSMAEALRDQNGLSQLVFGMEPTGNYHKPLGTFLIKHNQQVVLVSGIAVQRNRELLDGRWDKNDTKCAANVADLISQGKCLFYDYPMPEISGLRSLLSLRERIKKNYHILRMRIRNNLIAEYFPEFDRYFGQSPKQSLAIVKYFLDPQKINRMEFKQFLLKVTTTNRGLAQEKRLRQIHALASESIGCEINRYTEFEAQVLVDQMEQTKSLVKEIEEKIAEAAGEFAEYHCLLTIPGFGPYISALVLAKIGNPFRFENRKQVIKMSGLDLSAKRSGKGSDKAYPVISKKGSNTLRYALFQAAVIASSRNKYFIQYFTNTLKGREKERGIKIKMRVKLAAKLLVIAWSIMKTKNAFDPALFQSVK
jgi:transposase